MQLRCLALSCPVPSDLTWWNWWVPGTVLMLQWGRLWQISSSPTYTKDLRKWRCGLPTWDGCLLRGLFCRYSKKLLALEMMTYSALHYRGNMILHHYCLPIAGPFPMPGSKIVQVHRDAHVILAGCNTCEWPFRFILSRAAIWPLYYHCTKHTTLPKVVYGQPGLVVHCMVVVQMVKRNEHE